VAALASVKTGSWMMIFWIMIVCNVVAAFLAMFWLKPVAAATLERAKQMQEESAQQLARAKASVAGS
jgi:phosphotransferase system  glucose/maltose/N-acetylglucosamine-specific IIC component